MAYDVRRRTGAEPTTLDPGELRHRVQIQSQISVPDAFGGGVVDTWVTILTTWADIEVLAMKELSKASNFTSHVTHTITMRYRPTIVIGPRMRVLFQGHAYTIQAISNVQQRNVVLKLLCLEVDGTE